MKPLVLSRMRPADLARWEAAIRVGREVIWRGPVPEAWTQAELEPLARMKSVGAASFVGRFRPPEGSRTGPPVTVVIPCHQRAPWGLAALRRQVWDTRVLVVSNGAGPRTVEGATVWRTRWSGHADTRRRALEQVDTPFVMMMSDDAIPLGSGFVEQMVRALEGNPADAVVARQVPWPTADLRTRMAIRTWTPPDARTILHADHVCTLYRTDQLRRFATVDVPIAEDLAWTLGRSVHLASEAPVLHSHPPQVRARFARRLEEHRVRAQLGMPLPVDGLRAGLRALAPAVAGLDGIDGIALRVADVMGMAIGAHLGRHSARREPKQ